jgi:hypothetical protein
LFSDHEVQLRCLCGESLPTHVPAATADRAQDRLLRNFSFILSCTPADLDLNRKEILRNLDANRGHKPETVQRSTLNFQRSKHGSLSVER